MSLLSVFVRDTPFRYQKVFGSGLVDLHNQLIHRICGAFLSDELCAEIIQRADKDTLLVSVKRQDQFLLCVLC